MPAGAPNGAAAHLPGGCCEVWAGCSCRAPRFAAVPAAGLPGGLTCRHALWCRVSLPAAVLQSTLQRLGACTHCLAAPRLHLIASRPADCPLPKLQKEVFKLEQDASDDVRTDPRLLRACKQEIARMCSDQDKHGGKVQVGLAAQCVFTVWWQQAKM